MYENIGLKTVGKKISDYASSKNKNLQFPLSFYYHFNLHDGIIERMSKPKIDGNDQPSSKSSKELFETIVKRNLSQFTNLIEKTEKKDSNDVVGATILSLICYRKDAKFLEVALSRGSDANRKNNYENYPLQIATQLNWTEGVKLLIDYGADVNAWNKENEKCLEHPLSVAAKYGCVEAYFVLKSSNADTNALDRNENTLLHLACFSHCYKIIEDLLQSDSVNINAENSRQETVLHLLMKRFTKDTKIDEDCLIKYAKALVCNGVNINAPTLKGKTALYIAVNNRLLSAALFLLDYGANPDILTNSKKSILHAACKSSDSTILEVLLDTCPLQMFLLQEDSKKRSPFHIAVSNHDAKCCDVLFQYGENLANIDSCGKSRCQLILEKLPNATNLIEKILNSGIILPENENIDKDFFIKFDFSVLGRSPHMYYDSTIINSLNSNKVLCLFRHPIIECYLYFKWLNIRYLFYTNLLVYLLFLFFHSYIITNVYTGPKQKSVSVGVIVIEILLLLYLIAMYLIHLLANFNKYKSQFETYLQAVAFILAFTIAVIQRKSPFSEGFERVFASISIFLNWIQVMMLIGRLPTVGVYVLMFSKILKSLLKFAMSFLSLVVAFALSFAVLFHKLEYFQNVFFSFVKTLMMMVGEIDYNTIYSEMNITRTFDSDEFSWEFFVYVSVMKLFLISFVFLVPILLINLLIALAVTDMASLQSYGRIRRLLKEASYIEAYETVLNIFNKYKFRFVYQWFFKRVTVPKSVIVYPNLPMPKNKHENFKVPSKVLKRALSIAIKKKIYGQDLLFSSESTENFANYSLLNEVIILQQNILEKIDMMVINNNM